MAFTGASFVSTVFNFTGLPQQFNVSYETSYIIIVACGGQGGSGGWSAGFPGLISSAFSGVSFSGTTLYVYVGGNGEGETGSETISLGGYNGGGNGGAGYGSNGYGDQYWSGTGGGGASDVRTSLSLTSRILVAGGGGGAGTGCGYSTAIYNGGKGGGMGSGSWSGYNNVGGEGNQTGGGVTVGFVNASKTCTCTNITSFYLPSGPVSPQNGALGIGGNAYSFPCFCENSIGTGGGGGGYYGGAGGSVGLGCGGAGGGGSSYSKGQILANINGSSDCSNMVNITALLCAAGSFANVLDTSCTVCPIGKYTTKPYLPCTMCPWPTTTYKVGSTTCMAMSFLVNTNVAVGVTLGVFLIYEICWGLAGEYHFALALNFFIPMADHLTDIFYMLTQVFASPILFYLALLAILFPTVFFVRDIAESKKFPKVKQFPFLWLGYDIEYYPTLLNVRFPYTFDSHETFLKALWFVVLWIGCILAQALTPLFILCRLIFLFIWFWVGAFLYQCRVFSVFKVRTFWTSVWCGTTNKSTSDDLLDRRLLNESLLVGFLATTLPNLCIQVGNNTLIGTWTAFQYLSVCLSAFMIANGLWKYCYWYLIRRIPLKDIPLPQFLPFKSFGGLNLDANIKTAPKEELLQGPDAKLGGIMLQMDVNSTFSVNPILRINLRHSFNSIN